MKSCAKLIITLIKKETLFDSFEILNSFYYFNKITTDNLIIDIPDEKFGISKEKIIIEIKLISKSEFNIFNLNVYYGINKAYFFLSPINHITQLYEFYFYKPIKVEYKDGQLTETDSFEDDSRSRMILINPPYNIVFDEITFETSEFKPIKNTKIDSDNSFEVAIFDISKNYYASKVIKKKEIFSIIEKIKIYKNDLDKFYNDIQKLYNEKEDNIDKYLSIINAFKIPKIEINFSQNKSTLKNEFKEEQDYYMMYLYLLWYVLGLFCSKLKQKKNENDNEEDKKEKIEPFSIRDIIELSQEIYLKYLDDKDLLIYEKIMMIYSNIYFLIRCPNKNDYTNSNLKYIKRKDIKSKSIFGIALNFMKEFIEKLNPKSYLFYPLLLLDCGLYKTKDKEPIYGFNLETCSHLKSHLNELIPDVFFIYQEQVRPDRAEGGFNYKGFGIIFINTLLSLDGNKTDPITYEYTNNDEERENKNFGMRASKVMMHESFCHNKFIFEYTNGEQSPCNFYNKEMNLIKIIPVNTSNYDENYFRASMEYGKGESGKFFEYFFGLYFNELIIDLIYKVKYIGKLIDNVDYFVKENLNVIKDYIICKYQIKEKNIEYNDYNELSLEKEILNMKNLIKNHQISLIQGIKSKYTTKDDNNDNNDKIQKNANKLYGFKFIEVAKQESEYKGYNYYKKKAQEAKTNDEFFKYSAELVFNHLKVV